MTKSKPAYRSEDANCVPTRLSSSLKNEEFLELASWNEQGLTWPCGSIRVGA